MTYKQLLVIVILNFINVGECPPDEQPVALDKSGNSSKGVNRVYLELEKRIRNAADLVARGDELVALGEHNEAIDFYTRAIKKKNTVPPSYYKKRGICYMHIFQHLELALEDFKTVVEMLEKKPSENEKMSVISDKDLGDLGNKLYRTLDYAGAKWCFDQAIKINPIDASYYIMRGRCCTHLKEWALALADFKKALEIDPDDLQSRDWLMSLFSQSGRYEDALDESLGLYHFELARLGDLTNNEEKRKEAIKFYTAAIEKSPETVEYFKKRGKCYMMLEYWEKAIDDLQKVVEVQPFNVDVCQDLNRALIQCGRADEAHEALRVDKVEYERTPVKEITPQYKYEVAIQYYTEKIKENSSEPLYFKRRGECFLKLKYKDEAIADLKKVLELNPENQEIRIQLSKMFFDDGKYDEAIKEMVLANDLNELAKLGNQFVDLNRFEEALRCYNEAIEKKSSETLFYKLRSDCHLKMNNVDKAISDLKYMLELDSSNHIVRTQLSKILFNIGKYNKAIDEMVLANNDTELIELGNLLVNINKFENAIRCYNEAIKKNPSNEAYYEKRGTLYWNLKEFDEAILDFIKSLEIVPNNIAVQAYLCETLFDAGRFNEAKEGLQLFLKNIEYRKYKYRILPKEDVDKIEDVRQKLEKEAERLGLKKEATIEKENETSAVEKEAVLQDNQMNDDHLNLSTFQPLMNL